MIFLRPAAIAVFISLFASAAMSAEDEEAKRLRLAQDLIEITQAEQMIDQMVAQMAPINAQVMKSMLPEGSLSDARLQTITEATTIIMKEELAPEMASLIRAMAPVYAEVLTTEELEGVLAFYNSPVGAALLAKQPELISRSLDISARWSQEALPAIMARTQPRFQELIQELSAETDE